MGPNPTQGFLYNLKEGHTGDIEEQLNDNATLMDSVKVLPNAVRSEYIWIGAILGTVLTKVFIIIPPKLGCPVPKIIAVCF